MIIQIVRFRSALSDSDVMKVYEARAPRYRALKGLLQKHYLKYATGEHGAVYIWDTGEALAEFRQSELARSIPEAFKVQGTPEVQAGEVVFTLRPE